MKEVDKLIERVQHFCESPYTRDIGMRIKSLLIMARTEAAAKPNHEDLRIGVRVAKGFQPLFGMLTPESHLDDTAFTIDCRIGRHDLWEIPVSNLGYPQAQLLESIYHYALSELGYSNDRNAGVAMY
jgi:hypothetical protein